MFPRNTIGTFPTCFFVSWIQLFRSYSVSLRVTSHTARTPWHPSKYASLRRARKPFSPMMSHTIRSIRAGSPRHTTGTVFFVTFVPTVATYRSSKVSRTNRFTRDVLPTAVSPTRLIFALMCLRLATMVKVMITSSDQELHLLR